MSKRRGYPWRVRRCFVCHRIAVTSDPKTGDDLCAFCYQQRKALREAVAQLQNADGSKNSNDQEQNPFSHPAG